MYVVPNGKGYHQKQHGAGSNVRYITSATALSNTEKSESNNGAYSSRDMPQER